jgi:uncharacterized protein YqhQ
MQVGGMALRDGVLLQSPTHWAAAVRLPDGSLRVRSGRKPVLPGRAVAGRVPVARGLARLADNLTCLAPARRQLGRPVLPQEDPALLAATLGSATLSAVMRRSRRGSPLVRELAITALTLVPALLAIRSSELSRFHGAEHKSIAAYEGGGDARGAAKEHDRCGSNLIGPMLVTNLAGGLALRGLGRTRNPVANLLVGLVGLGTAVEIFGWMARHRGHPLAGLMRSPGIRMQRLVTTREPTDDQLDVAQAALEELIRVSGQRARETSAAAVLAGDDATAGGSAGEPAGPPADGRP